MQMRSPHRLSDPIVAILSFASTGWSRPFDIRRVTVVQDLADNGSTRGASEAERSIRAGAWPREQPNSPMWLSQ
jgi:hypothetical protein